MKKCKFFGSRAYCLHKDNEKMKKFLRETEIPQSNTPVMLDFSELEEIGALCSSCPKFTPSK